MVMFWGRNRGAKLYSLYMFGYNWNPPCGDDGCKCKSFYLMTHYMSSTGNNVHNSFSLYYGFNNFSSGVKL